MGISVEEMKKMDESTYQIIDIRSQIEIDHGGIAVCISGGKMSERYSGGGYL